MQTSICANNYEEFKNILTHFNQCSWESQDILLISVDSINDVMEKNLHFFPQVQSDPEVKMTLSNIKDRATKELSLCNGANELAEKLNLYTYNFPIKLLELKLPEEISKMVFSKFKNLNFENLRVIACLSTYWNAYSTTEKKIFYLESKANFIAEIKKLSLEKNENFVINLLESNLVDPAALDDDTIVFLKKTFDKDTLNKILMIYEDAGNIGNKIGLDIFEKSSELQIII